MAKPGMAKPAPERAPTPDTEADADDAPKLKPVKYPGSVKAAGILWLLVGLFQVLFSLFMVMTADDLKKYSGLPPQQAQNVRTGLYISAGVVAVIGIAFTVTGLQAITGMLSSVKGAGIASIVFAVLTLLAALREFQGDPHPVTVAVGLAQSLGLFLAGLLAMNGAIEYQNWRRWVKRKQKAKGVQEQAEPLSSMPSAKATSPDVAPPKPVKYPGTVKAAGILWLLIGLAYFAWIGLAYYAVVSDEVDPAKRNIPTQTRPAAGAAAKAEAVLTTVYVLMGVAAVLGLIFSIVGLQAITGAVSSILGSGLGSIFLGLLALLGAVALIMSDNTAVLPAGIGSLMLAFGLILAGGLAASGATQFKKWRRWKKETAVAAKKAKRKAKPRDDGE